jgi:NAD(P)-dependent dehydrogenase (short-subunit alcohol dehydrogenase family)
MLARLYAHEFPQTHITAVAPGIINTAMMDHLCEEADTETPSADLKQVMEVNLWANKAIMDWLHGWGRPIDQILMISSGAAVLGNKGWNGYALSKAALNMLARLYAH